MSRYGAEKTDENDKRVLAGGRELGFYEEEYKDSSGNMRQWLVNKLPILDAAGEIENIVTVALDIGERKRVEFEMRKAKDAAEGGAAQFAGDPEFADRGGKARRPRPAGGGRRPRGQQSRRHQPDGRLRAGAQDRECSPPRSRAANCGAPA